MNRVLALIAVSLALAATLAISAAAQTVDGWQTVYLDTSTQANARALAASLGSNLPANGMAAGDQNYCFQAYTPMPGHDDSAYGFAVLARFNTATSWGASSLAAVQASGYVQATPSNPSAIFQ